MIVPWLACEVLISVAAGIIAASSMVLLTWWVFGLVRHPDFGPPLLFIGLVLALHRQAGTSDFVQMLLLFVGLFAIGIRIIDHEPRIVSR